MGAVWLADVLRAAGCKVEEIWGWKERGRPGQFGPIQGILCHHTACLPGTQDHPSLGTVIHGRADLPGPLCHLHLSRSGVYSVVAAGRANHAGAGEWNGIRSGNTHFIGIEAENCGLPCEPWDEHLMVEYAKGSAAILNHIGAPVSMCAGHKEYALPAGRKIDPSFDMDEFRARVAEWMKVLEEKKA